MVPNQLLYHTAVHNTTQITPHNYNCTTPYSSLGELTPSAEGAALVMIVHHFFLPLTIH